MNLSLVVPIYNKEKVLIESITGIIHTLRQTGLTFEIIAVVDGASDNSAQELSKIEDPTLKKIILAKNHGKGNAIKQGMKIATGEYIGFMDCGLDISLGSLYHAVMYIPQKYDAIIATKSVYNSVVKTSFLRSLYSLGFKMIRNTLFSLSEFDTQVGLKVYRGDMIKSILPRIEERRWLFDLEVFLWMDLINCTNIREIPASIDMNNPFENSQSAKISSIINMLIGLVKLSLRIGNLSATKNLLTLKGFRPTILTAQEIALWQKQVSSDNSSLVR